MTAPVIADGRLYLRDNNRLFCYDIRAERTGPQPDPKKITLSTFGPADQRERDSGALRSVFVSTPQDIVEKMLALAKVKKTDIVYDLGSGDGRIVITAAKTYGCRAVGFEIDEQLVKVSRKYVTEAGVGQLVTIEQQDLFTADLNRADVITLYLLPKQLEALVPQLMKLKPGTRIVSHQFGIPGIKLFDLAILTSEEDGEEHKIYSWTAPIQARESAK